MASTAPEYTGPAARTDRRRRADADQAASRPADAASSSEGDFVIAKSGEGYRFAFINAGTAAHWVTLQKEGDTLKVTWQVPGSGGMPATSHWISFTSHDGQLRVRQDGLTDTSPAIMATKLSGATSGMNQGAAASTGIHA